MLKLITSAFIPFNKFAHSTVAKLWRPHQLPLHEYSMYMAWEKG